MAHPTARLFLQLTAQYKSWPKLNQCEREVGVCCLGTQVQLFIHVLSVLSCDCLTCEWKYTSCCNGYRMLTPDSVRRWGYLVPFCKVTPNKIKQRKYTLLCFFITVWVGPSRTAAKSNMAEKALGSLNQQHSVKLARLFLACILPSAPRELHFWPRCFCGFFVTVSQAEGRLKLCHADRKPFLLCCANRAA